MHFKKSIIHNIPILGIRFFQSKINRSIPLKTPKEVLQKATKKKLQKLIYQCENEESENLKQFNSLSKIILNDKGFHILSITPHFITIQKKCIHSIITIKYPPMNTEGIEIIKNEEESNAPHSSEYFEIILEKPGISKLSAQFFYKPELTLIQSYFIPLDDTIEEEDIYLSRYSTDLSFSLSVRLLHYLKSYVI